MIFLQLLFLVLITHQVIKTAIAMWTGYRSDVPFESTNRHILKKLLIYLQQHQSQLGISLEPEANNLNKNTFYDIGSGSGRVSFFFAHHTSLTVTGVEKNWLLFTFSRMKKMFSPGKNQPQFIHQDLFALDLTQVNILYSYLSPQVHKKAQSKFEAELQPGAIFIAWRFPFNSPQFKLIATLTDKYSMYIYHKQRPQQ